MQQETKKEEPQTAAEAAPAPQVPELELSEATDEDITVTWSCNEHGSGTLSLEYREDKQSWVGQAEWISYGDVTDASTLSEKFSSKVVGKYIRWSSC